MALTDQLARAGAPTARGRATRDRIVVAAAQMIHARGVERTTLDDVRAATSVSKSQLYHYFNDKADLVRAVVARQAQAVLTAQQPELDAIESFAGLQRWRDKVVALQAEHDCSLGCPLGTLVAALADDELGRLALASAFEAWQERLRDGLAAIRDHATQGGLLLAQSSRSVLPLALCAAPPVRGPGEGPWL